MGAYADSSSFNNDEVKSMVKLFGIGAERFHPHVTGVNDILPTLKSVCALKDNERWIDKIKTIADKSGGAPESITALSRTNKDIMMILLASLQLGCQGLESPP